MALLLGLAMAAQAAPPGSPVIHLDPDVGFSEVAGAVTWANSGSVVCNFTGSGTKLVAFQNGHDVLSNGGALVSSVPSDAWDVTTEVHSFLVWDNHNTSGNAGSYANIGNYDSWSYVMAGVRSPMALGVGTGPTWTWAAVPGGDTVQLWIEENRGAGGVMDTFFDGVNIDDVPGNAWGGSTPVTTGTFHVMDMGGYNVSYGELGEFLLYVGPVDVNAVGVYLQTKWNIQGAYEVVVPEPAGLGLLGVALLGLRKRRS